ncbi:hypothetical protein BDV95DRAFT_587522 [Massariosphaeria phaeospora]|uniref:BTB domain-containing protein n=1 Tax=Massariosphaeria phaeospora TaxID=100035 RepID=A0A7C8I163_9PLEO|nr:hypothetical protein BDV95DRAFT_587522 [Massariosphaeria phaeospora]
MTSTIYQNSTPKRTIVRVPNPTDNDPVAFKQYLFFENQLTRTSKYFQGECGSPWHGAGFRPICIHVAKVPEFDAYGYWLYTKLVFTPSDTGVDRNAPVESKAKQAYEELLSLYSFGDRLGDTTFMNVVVANVVNRLRSPIGLPRQFIFTMTCDKVQNIFTEYPRRSPLHKLIVDAVARFATEADLQHFLSRNYLAAFKDELDLAQGRQLREMRESKGMDANKGAMDFGQGLVGYQL